MELIHEFGTDDLAKVYVCRMRNSDDHLVECVESLQPPRPRSEKWVLIVSTLFGCPVGCAMCDAGGRYGGRLTAAEILEQIRFLVRNRFGGDKVPARKFKIQFARMGEPALNPAVLEVLERLPSAFDAPGLLPSVSSVAPAGSESFFEELIRLKDESYGGGRFQLQFSIHSTDPDVRRKLIPVRCLPFEWMGEYGARFKRKGDQRISLNFAAVRDVPLEPDKLERYFDPDLFLIKLTPLNPTVNGARARLASGIDPYRPESGAALARRFEEAGFRVILSIGEVEENRIGSNCGQYVSRIGQITNRQLISAESAC
jgi:23S rRNA (adenine2503-C2)-methyltransferase